ncbi:T6SS immunity protein Tli4 family protein [Burkholderia multivorans]|uniref:T6SS immunity protein Tli4 family protein n=1 Tax=Burkholderia multivorans TaxID=87883 RepID=UPI002157EE95|nr:T6SS immunity protein Tli4 family protein [Burkholderia multivorans]
MHQEGYNQSVGVQGIPLQHRGKRGRYAGAEMLTRFVRYLFFVVGLCTCSITFSGEPAMTNPLLSEPRPWCIGRFVFDRPGASEITNQRYEYWGDKLETQHNASHVDYQANVDELEKKYRTKRRFDPSAPDNKFGPVWLERELSPTKNSKVFIYQKGIAKAVRLPFDVEGYVYENNTLFHTTGSIGSSALDEFEPIYTDLYRRIKARDNWSVPTESGFCFDGGIATGSSTSTEEVSQSFALMPGRPALLVIQMRDSVDVDQKEPLSKTLRALRSQMNRISSGSYRILRQGKRTVAGMDAEEVLFALKEGEITSYRFYLLAPGDPSTLAKPHTAIQLILGASSADLTPEEATSPVDEAGALQTWDTLLNSLRLRPGAV